jgi:RNA polymerase sigma-70 factor (sigma-E family)
VWEAIMVDTAAFAAFVHEHSRSLFGTAYLLTGSPDAAEELLQDTLARLFPHWDKVAAADSPLAYARRALGNRFVSAQRGRASRELAKWEPPQAVDPRDMAEGVANRELVWHLLGLLPERQRAAIVMRYFHDLPDGEIALSLACRPATVRSLLSRGVAALREQLAQPDTALLRMRGDER